MLLDLNDVLHQSGQVMSRDFRLDVTALDDVELAGPVHGRIRVQNARRNLVISGEADATVLASCARCLKAFPYDLHLTFETAAPLSLFQLPGQTVVTDEPVHEEDDLLDDEIRALFSEHNLNLSELVRQSIWLLMPISPLCAEDCDGLASLVNSGDTVDPRLEALKRWDKPNGK